MKQMLKSLCLLITILSTGAYATPLTVISLAIFDNDYLHFGNGGHLSATYTDTEESVNTNGTLNQPFYWDTSTSQWSQLTYQDYPLDTFIGIDGNGTNNWNLNGSINSSLTLSNQVLDKSGFIITNGNRGYGTIISKGIVNINGSTLELTYKYTLNINSKYIKVTTIIKNISGNAISNLRFWIGTKDDYIGGSDSTDKSRGNFVNGVYIEVTNASDPAQVIKLTGTTAGLYLFSSSSRANGIISTQLGTAALINTDPNSNISIPDDDGSYAMYVRLNDLNNNESDEVTVYYAAGMLLDLVNIANTVPIQNLKPSVEDTNTTFSSNDFNDYNGATPSIIKVISLPTYGTLMLNANIVSLEQNISNTDFANLVYIPEPNYAHTDSFSVERFDVSNTLLGETVTTFEIANVNDAPVINTLFNDITINTTTTYDINISDLEVNDLNLTIESNNTNILTVTPNWNAPLNSNSWIQEFNLTTVANATGTVRITIVLSDGELNSTKTFDVNVTAAPVVISTGGGSTGGTIGGTTGRITATESSDILLDSDNNGTTVRIEENLEVSSTDVDGLKGIEVEVNGVTIIVQVNSNGQISGSLELKDEEGELVSTTIDINLPQSNTQVRSDGSLNTNIEIEEHMVNITLDADGSVKYEVETPEGETRAISAIAGSSVEVTEEGVLVITSKIKKNGVIYVAVLTTDVNGKTSTKFNRINTLTEEEIEVENTLAGDTRYSVGSRSKIFELEDITYIETTTSLNNRLITE